MDDLSSKLKAVYRLSERYHVEKEVYDLDWRPLIKEVLGTLKLLIGIRLKVKNTEDKSLDIQVWTAKIDAESNNML